MQLDELKAFLLTHKADFENWLFDNCESVDEEGNLKLNTYKFKKVRDERVNSHWEFVFSFNDKFYFIYGHYHSENGVDYYDPILHMTEVVAKKKTITVYE